MKTLRKYIVYVDDGEDCFKIAVPAESKLKAEEYCKGNGDVIAVKDITDDCPIDIEKICLALRYAKFGEIEIQLIERTLTGTMIAE